MSDQQPAVAFESKRLIFRAWREEDRDPFAALNEDPRVMEFLPFSFTREQSDATIDKMRAHFDRYGYGIWPVERRDNGAFIGIAGFTNLASDDATAAPLIEITCRFLPKFWVGGLSTEACHACLRYGLTVLKLPEIFAYTSTTHVTSRRLMERIGMVHDERHDFMSPFFPEEHPLRPQVLYRITHDIFIA